MKKLSILLTSLSLALLSLTGRAQNGLGKISGRLSDGSRPIEAATVSLLSAKDSSIAKMELSHKTGVFEIENIDHGRYLVAVSAIGFNQAYSPVFELNETNNNVELATITLSPKAKDLKAVTVVARKPLIEQKIDRTVINVEAAVSNAGATALEVLEKSPGITVDKDGNISLKGKQGVQVFIDGRPSYLSGTELVNLLKNMNANQLDQVEIMTNPPAKYDAAGNAGIINIKTKKNKIKGFNGSVNAGYSQGIYWRTNESLNLNYRNGKYNAFLNYSYNHYNSLNQLTIHRSYQSDDLKSVRALFDQVATMHNNNANNNLKFGMDFFPDKKTTIGFVASGFINPEKFSSYNTSYLKNGSAQTDSIVYATGTSKDSWKNGSVNLNFRRQFDTSGRELSADLDYSRYASHNRQTFMNASFDPNWAKRGETDLYSELPVDINIYSAKLDYTRHFKNGLKLETGLKSSYVNTDNAADYFNLSGGVMSPDYDKTNRFRYNENINAAYVNLSRQFKKFGAQAGLRFENTNYRGHQLGNVQKRDSSFARTYNDVFPTVFLSYNADKNSQFGLSVGRRIDRPAYQDLNPFLFFIDNYTYQSGNPFLKPQYTNNIELSHTFKGFLTTTLNYSKTKNFFTETFEQNKDTTKADKGFATIVRRGNIGMRDNAGISVSAQVPVTKWWTAVLYGNYNYSHFSGPLNGETVDITGSNLMFNANNQFQLGRGWSAELSGWYRTKGIEGQIILNQMGAANAGISKQVLKGKGSLRVNIRDIFSTQNASGDINFQKTAAHFQNKRDSRVAGISFNYRFGKPLKDQQNNRRTGGAADEQSRVNTGNNN